MSLFQSVYLWLINLKISYSSGGYSPLIFLFACPLLIGPFMPLLEERTVPRRPTYALHEERDLYQIHFYIIVDFLIHTLRGERDEVSAKQCCRQYISTHTLRGERDSTYCICEVTPPQQSGDFTKNHLKKRYFLHNMYYFFSEPPYKTNITARSLTKSNCPQDHMFPLHLYAPLSSSNYYPNNRIEGYLVLHQ